MRDYYSTIRGGHWGILETAKPKKNYSKTAKPQTKSAKTENRIQNCIPKQVQIEKKQEKPKTTLGTKTEKPLVFFTKTENQMLKNEKSANGMEHQNRKPEVF